MQQGLHLEGGGGEGVEDGEEIGDVSTLDAADAVGVGEQENLVCSAELGQVGGYECFCHSVWSIVGVW